MKNLRESLKVLRETGIRVKLDEDWRQSARDYKNAKETKDIHDKRLESLRYKIPTSLGRFSIDITPSMSYSNEGQYEVCVHLNNTYVCANWLYDIESLKKYLYDGGLSDDIYRNVASVIKFDSKTDRAMARKKVQDFEAMLDDLDLQLSRSIDFDDLQKKMHRYVTYYKAYMKRENNKRDLHYKARNEYEKEHGDFKVGDIVYGCTPLKPGKEYVVTKVEPYTVNWKSSIKQKIEVEPENGRGRGWTVYNNDLTLSTSQSEEAISNPDDPKYDKKFDQREYMMNRYSALNDEE